MKLHPPFSAYAAGIVKDHQPIRDHHPQAASLVAYRAVGHHLLNGASREAPGLSPVAFGRSRRFCWGALGGCGTSSSSPEVSCDREGLTWPHKNQIIKHIPGFPLRVGAFEGAQGALQRPQILD